MDEFSTALSFLGVVLVLIAINVQLSRINKNLEKLVKAISEEEDD